MKELDTDSNEIGSDGAVYKDETPLVIKHIEQPVSYFTLIQKQTLVRKRACRRVRNHSKHKAMRSQGKKRRRLCRIHLDVGVAFVFLAVIVVLLLMALLMSASFDVIDVSVVSC